MVETVERHDSDEPACVGQWCCGCQVHPAGKPWGWNWEAWVQHALAVHHAAGEEPAKVVPAARAEKLAGALRDAQEVFGIVYDQLTNMDRELDAVERSMIAENELAQANERLTAALAEWEENG